MQNTRRGVLALGGGLVLSGCAGRLGGSEDGGTSSNDGVDVESVSLLLNWNLGGLHAPYVAAREEGFYADEGFADIEIESGDGSDFAANQAGLGNTEFAVSSGDQILTVNSNELSPRAVGIVMQRNPNVVFADREEFGELTDPEQLEDVTVGSGPGMVRTMTEAYLDHHGLLDTVEYVDAGFDTVQQLLAGEIDVAGGVFSDVVDARHQGREIDVLETDEAVASYGHLIATDESFAEDHPETVEAFLRATARGAVWAARNPDAAIDHLVDVQPELAETRENQYDKWEQMYTEYMLSETVEREGWGASAPDPWRETHEVLADGDVLENEVDPDAVWTNDYLDAEDEYVSAFADRIDG
ncbi:ABC transporter substrate-binding protein [Natronococcus occultus]|uniref:Thiamine pyrimidine synthase n=1 Tax=Natronococcus occultus SP4 TaxID=694430 RepID=L0K0B0_9EURY|nr:ABC transporter substrate-binding protein [Natronococcus occultus]AGB37563.1 ABC-type nitrate/sulfonate/bicarbonate transport system, periplasmic component [Natronococcus occultus SP4]